MINDPLTVDIGVMLADVDHEGGEITLRLEVGGKHLYQFFLVQFLWRPLWS